jgi:4-hydroxy-2-oxoheptanedioate aldolase
MLGVWCHLPTPFASEIVGRAGYDWACLDQQHGLIRDDVLHALILALEVTSTPALVRVAANDPTCITRALDLGADGVIVPMVDDAEDARRAVAACRYAPLGERSWGPIRPVMRDPAFTAERSNSAVRCIVMAETRTALQHIDDIASVPGVDGIFVGPSDLAVSLGRHPRPSVVSGEQTEMLQPLLRACERHGVVPGAWSAGPDAARAWVGAGFRLVSVNTDSRLLLGAASAELAAARTLEESSG